MYPFEPFSLMYDCMQLYCKYEKEVLAMQSAPLSIIK